MGDEIIISKQDYYKILGVDKDSSLRQIKVAYRDLAMQYHPDKALKSEQESAEERFKQINQAYQVLSDPDKRRSYDRWGHVPPNRRMRGGSTVVYSPFNQSHSSRREQIEDKLSEGIDFGIQEFAKHLGVKPKNLIKILEKFIQTKNINAQIIQGIFTYH